MSRRNHKPKVTLTLNVGGVRFVVATVDTCEDVSFVVCLKVTIPLVMPDNLTAPCVDCGDMLQFRPYNPKRPPRLCIDCATIRAIKPDRRKELP